MFKTFKPFHRCAPFKTYQLATGSTLIESGAVGILALEKQDVARMRELMRKYRDLPMDLADAALVRVAEHERLRRIFTLDRHDFQTYRPSRIGRFVILPSR